MFDPKKLELSLVVDSTKRGLHNSFGKCGGFRTFYVNKCIKSNWISMTILMEIWKVGCTQANHCYISNSRPLQPFSTMHIQLYSHPHRHHYSNWSTRAFCLGFSRLNRCVPTWTWFISSPKGFLSLFTISYLSRLVFIFVSYERFKSTTFVVQLRLCYGMILFIVSKVMSFLALFRTFFHSFWHLL